MKVFYFLESNGAYDMADEKVLDNMKKEIRERMQTLSVPAPKIASDFYTPEEMVNKTKSFSCCFIEEIIILWEMFVFFLRINSKNQKR